LKSLLIALLILGAAAAAGYYFMQEEFVRPGPATQSLRVEVEPGTSVRGVLALLAQRGTLSRPRVIEAYLRMHGEHLTIKAGTYEIAAGASAADIIELLREGRVVLEALTIVEGSTFAQLREELASDTDIVSTLAHKSDAEVMAAIDHAGEDPELPFDTSYKALILASIVEKETGIASERARIAGVFVSRLRAGMRLQSDPTVIYGLGTNYDGEIHTRDLSTDTPYNTYTRVGLPPTPIALPGREALHAAVQPDVTGDLYFVATGAGDGAHHFSKTLEEHNAAVKQYLTRLKQAASK
jgi:UPF0755 protein